MGSNIPLTTEQFILKAKLTHGDRYDYSLVEYKRWNKNISIICKEHGIFYQLPNNHIRNHGCPKCRSDKLSYRFRQTKDEFIKKANEIHDNKYDYSLVEYKANHYKVKIICKIHGVFEQKPNSHLSYIGCPKCNLSKGEMFIELWLKKNNISYIPQKRFEDCKNIKPLPFDFYLLDYNTCIEFDGEQHFKPVLWHNISNVKAKSNFNDIKINDCIKDKYCKESGIKLIRIPYTKIKKIDLILEKIL